MTVFVTWGFPVTGQTTNRTLPDRLAETKNVKDFGAVGNGSTDDRAAIQAAIDWTSGADRGTIYFPQSTSTYLIGSPGLTLNYNGALTIAFRGEGSATRLSANFDGFQFTRTLATASNEADITFDNLNLTNAGLLGGNCRIGSAKKVAFRNCSFSGHISYTGENTDGGLCSSRTMFSSCFFAGTGTLAGSRGLIMAGGVIEGTDLRGYDVGYRIAGAGTTIWGGRTERCNTAMEFGVGNASEARGSATDIGAQGVAVVAHTLEGHWIAMDFLGTTEGFFGSGLYLLGHDSSNSGATPGIANTQHGMLIRSDKLKAATIASLSGNNIHDIACVQINDPTVRPNIVFTNGTVLAQGAGADWINSTKAMAARFIECNNDPIFTFANLPGSSDRQEGDEYNLSDARRASDSAAITAADWGVAVTGGGSSRCRVRFNGTSWTVVSI